MNIFPYLYSMSYTCSYHHIVFSTRNRYPSIPMDKRDELYRYISGIIRNKSSVLIEINGMQEHIHILIDLHPTVALSDIVKSIKQSSSKWLGRNGLYTLFDGWGAEYYASSVSPSHVDSVRTYIRNQEEHHNQDDFYMEMENFVRKMGMKLYKDSVE